MTPQDFRRRLDDLVNEAMDALVLHSDIAKIVAALKDQKAALDEQLKALS